MPLLPLVLGISGRVSAGIALVCGILFTLLTVQLMRTQDRKAALSIMFASFLYLPIVQVALVLDKV